MLSPAWLCKVVGSRRAYIRIRKVVNAHTPQANILSRFSSPFPTHISTPHPSLWISDVTVGAVCVGDSRKRWPGDRYRYLVDGMHVLGSTIRRYLCKSRYYVALRFGKRMPDTKREFLRRRMRSTCGHVAKTGILSNSPTERREEKGSGMKILSFLSAGLFQRQNEAEFGACCLAGGKTRGGSFWFTCTKTLVEGKDVLVRRTGDDLAPHSQMMRCSFG
ncbi:hypothetical protein CC80DRAFT_500979 [Byssothecium circinans]|uniref:Uncharacterized protein n=1 Tax=Byssothecium circinans TaxID=147558 RepID=A0A6A5U7P4_9PLEO|nr:hypothetical protein CC80DRAFT_500979 [Byssothecium circinans]